MNTESKIIKAAQFTHLLQNHQSDNALSKSKSTFGGTLSHLRRPSRIQTSTLPRNQCLWLEGTQNSSFSPSFIHLSLTFMSRQLCFHESCRALWIAMMNMFLSCEYEARVPSGMMAIDFTPSEWPRRGLPTASPVLQSYVRTVPSSELDTTYGLSEKNATDLIQSE